MSNRLFGEDQWATLFNNPETAALLKDPEFSAKINELSKNPAKLSEFASDPRIATMFAALANKSTAPSPASTTNSKPKDSEEVKVPEKEEEDLSKLPEEERNKKLAFRAKEEGNVAYKKQDFPKAIELYTKAVELDPNTVAYLTNRAAAYLMSGAHESAIADCKLAVKLNTDNSLRTDFKIIARAYGRMGNAYLKQENYDEAINAFEKSLVEFTDSKIQKSLNETKKLKKKQEEMAYINPEISKAEREAGNALFKEGKFPESIAKYTEAIKRNPSDAAPYSNRAAAYMKLGEFPMALRDCDRCLEKDENYVKAYIRKGNIHFYMKEYHKCITVYEKGLKIAPDNRELKQGLMKTQMKIQQSQGGKVDEQQVQAAMRDPEIQGILQDPQINTILRQMEQDPSVAAKAMRDPDISSKVQKLIAAGILRVG